jgi:hypothetical protein
MASISRLRSGCGTASTTAGAGGLLASDRGKCNAHGARGVPFCMSGAVNWGNLSEP